MIDIESEELIPIRDVPDRLPRRPNGRKLHISAVYRWLQRGVRGVKLEYVQIGATRYTSIQAMQRFADRLSHRDVPAEAMTLPRARSQRANWAKREVERILYGKKQNGMGKGGLGR